MAQITTNALRVAWRGRDRWLSDGGARGAGRLYARLAREGVTFYYQYFGPKGRRFLPLASYDAQGVRGRTLPQARDEAAELSELYRKGITDLHAHFERERSRELEAREAEQKAKRLAQEHAQRSTLRQLLETYVAHLRRLEKSSAGDVENIFENHVFSAAPDLANRPANDISVDEFVGVIGKLTESGKGRTAGKLRSYLRAAYSLAIDARTDPAAPQSLRTFGITANPIASIGALSQFNRSRDRALNLRELSAFLKRVDAAPDGPKKDAMQACLGLGGQRPTQMLRSRTANVDLAAGVLILYDPKGARREPRRHVIPLTTRAITIFERLVHASDVPEAPLFTTDGCTAMRLETLSVFVAEISAEMVAAKEAREPFQLRDVRRTVETILASLGVPRDVRAHLQSHGLGGIQARHYDRHEYAMEKRAVLDLWSTYMERLKASEHFQAGQAHQQQPAIMRAWSDHLSRLQSSVETSPAWDSLLDLGGSKSVTSVA
jgi:integrase